MAELGGLARWGVRARLTLVSSLVLAVALGAAGVLAVTVARSALLQSLDDAAMQRAADVAGLFEAGPLPDPLPVTGAAVVQVVDAQERVVASSPGGDRLSPLLDGEGLAAARAGEAVGLPGARVGSSEPFRVLAMTAGQGRTSTVLVATSVAEVERAAAVLTRAVLLAVPVLVALMAALTWQVAGSALRPVEQLRLAAAATTAAVTSRRPLPVPPTDDEVGRLAVTLNDMLGRLDAASARQRAFVADAAHELRSPLGSLRTQLEVALARPATQDWAEVARGGVAEVERMSALVDDLLLLARLDEPVGRSGPVDVLEVAREAASRPRRTPVRVEPSAPEVASPPAVVTGDRRALFRVVANLLDNAARYAATSVVVTVGVSGVSGAGGAAGAAGAAGGTGTGPAVVLAVLDDGPGIPAADRERVFERFTRLDPSRDRDAGGTGLGLAIVRAEVQRHGGTVQAVDRPDGAPGGAVVVRLPAAAGG